MDILNRLKSGWTILKLIRVGLGTLILYSSVQSGHIAGIIVGSLFTIISLLSDGVCCAGVAGCYNPYKKNISSTHQIIDDEELGSK